MSIDKNHTMRSIHYCYTISKFHKYWYQTYHCLAISQSNSTSKYRLYQQHRWQTAYRWISANNAPKLQFYCVIHSFPAISDRKVSQPYFRHPNRCRKNLLSSYLSFFKSPILVKIIILCSSYINDRVHCCAGIKCKFCRLVQLIVQWLLDA